MQKKYIKRSQISPGNIRKNKGSKRIIFLGSVYFFNGHGWIEEKIATPDDVKKYPTLIED